MQNPFSDEAEKIRENAYSDEEKADKSVKVSVESSEESEESEASGESVPLDPKMRSKIQVKRKLVIKEASDDYNHETNFKNSKAGTGSEGDGWNSQEGFEEKA